MREEKEPVVTGTKKLSGNCPWSYRQEYINVHNIWRTDVTLAAWLYHCQCSSHEMYQIIGDIPICRAFLCDESSLLCLCVCLPVQYRSAHTFLCVNICLRTLKQNQNRKVKNKEETFIYIMQYKSPCQWLTCLSIVLGRILKEKQFNTKHENYSNL